jgi:coenzyme F420-reducing hydrogenase delta subunit
MSEEMKKTESEWKPRIVAYVCNWCTYGGADLAGTSRLTYVASVRVIKLPCTGRIDPLFLIKAFERGADGILVSGCHPGDCHYNSGNYHARRRWTAFRELIDFSGIDMRRLHFSWISAAEAVKWVDVINDVTTKIRELGPYEEFQSMNERTEEYDRIFAQQG